MSAASRSGQSGIVSDSNNSSFQSVQFGAGLFTPFNSSKTAIGSDRGNNYKYGSISGSVSQGTLTSTPRGSNDSITSISTNGQNLGGIGTFNQLTLPQSQGHNTPTQSQSQYQSQAQTQSQGHLHSAPSTSWSTAFQFNKQNQQQHRNAGLQQLQQLQLQNGPSSQQFQKLNNHSQLPSDSNSKSFIDFSPLQRQNIASDIPPTDDTANNKNNLYLKRKAVEADVLSQEVSRLRELLAQPASNNVFSVDPAVESLFRKFTSTLKEQEKEIDDLKTQLETVYCAMAMEGVEANRNFSIKVDGYDLAHRVTNRIKTLKEQNELLGVRIEKSRMTSLPNVENALRRTFGSKGSRNRNSA